VCKPLNKRDIHNSTLVLRNWYFRAIVTLDSTGDNTTIEIGGGRIGRERSTGSASAADVVGFRERLELEECSVAAWQNSHSEWSRDQCGCFPAQRDPWVLPRKGDWMSNFCNRTRSYANLYRLQSCTVSDEQTVHDPVDGCSRCRRCGERTLQCHGCSGRVHWKDSPCPHCGISLEHRWVKSNAPHPEPGPPPVSARAVPINEVVAEFFSLLPYEAAKGAYRLAIQELHPDKGGDPAKAASLNAAWQRIKSEIFNK
jgi:hypothetical protein